jgi:hypothetical protein
MGESQLLVDNQESLKSWKVLAGQIQELDRLEFLQKDLLRLQGVLLPALHMEQVHPRENPGV